MLWVVVRLWIHHWLSAEQLRSLELPPTRCTHAFTSFHFLISWLFDFHFHYIFNMKFWTLLMIIISLMIVITSYHHNIRFIGFGLYNHKILLKYLNTSKSWPPPEVWNDSWLIIHNLSITNNPIVLLILWYWFIMIMMIIVDCRFVDSYFLYSWFSDEVINLKKT